METKTTKQPTHRIKRGALEATIWQNDSKNGSYYRATLSRSYRNTAGKFAKTSSFGLKELADVAVLAIEAEGWMKDAEATAKEVAAIVEEAFEDVPEDTAEAEVSA